MLHIRLAVFFLGLLLHWSLVATRNNNRAVIIESPSSPQQIRVCMIRRIYLCIESDLFLYLDRALSCMRMAEFSSKNKNKRPERRRRRNVHCAAYLFFFRWSNQLCWSCAAARCYTKTTKGKKKELKALPWRSKPHSQIDGKYNQSTSSEHVVTIQRGSWMCPNHVNRPARDGFGVKLASESNARADWLL